MTNSKDLISKIAVFGVLAVSLTGLFLGGASRAEELGILLFFTACIVFFRPPVYRLGWAEILAVSLMMASVAASFAPSDWFPTWAWRKMIMEDYGLEVDSFLTPQPLLTLENSLVLGAGVLWLWYLAARPPEPGTREWVARLYCFGVAVLSALAVARYFKCLPFEMPFWMGDGGLGVFPNRNHFSSVLAVAAMLNLACIYSGFRSGRNIGFFHLLAWVPMLAGLVLNFSRAGLVLFFAGSLAWVGWVSLKSKSAKRLAISAALVLIMGSSFLLFGGETLKRFQNRSGGWNGVAVDDFRWKVAQDTWSVIREAPWCGVGLGNFESIFPHYRKESLSQTRVIHPENDWLLLAAEVGLPAGIGCLVGLFFLLGKNCPLEHDKSFWLRSAGFVGAVCFLVHGLVDVSGHRAGAVWPAMLVLWLAMPVPKHGKVYQAWMQPLFFRPLALMVGAAGLVFWSGSFFSSWEETVKAADKAHQTTNYELLEKTATRGLALRPLHWPFYYQRAAACAADRRGIQKAAADFARARFLQPNIVELYWNEGLIWLQANEIDRALAVWNEMFNISGSWRQTSHTQLPGETPESLYLDMLGRTKLRKKFRILSENRPSLTVLYMEKSSADEWEELLRSVLEQDPDLKNFTEMEKGRIFKQWEEKGDREELTRCLLENKDWQAAGVRTLAAYHAAQGRFEMAVRLLRGRMSPPQVPTDDGQKGLSSLELQFNQAPQDLYKGLRLLHAQIHLGQREESLETLARLKRIDNYPPHLFIWEADLLIARGEWEKAWNLLQNR